VFELLVKDINVLVQSSREIMYGKVLYVMVRKNKLRSVQYYVNIDLSKKEILLYGQ